MNSWTAIDMNHNKLAIKISSLYLTPGKPLNYPQCPIIFTPQHLDSGRKEEVRLHSRPALRGTPKVSKESYSTFQPDGWLTGLHEPGVGLMFWFELHKYDVCVIWAAPSCPKKNALILSPHARKSSLIIRQIKTISHNLVSTDTWAVVTALLAKCTHE